MGGGGGGWEVTEGGGWNAVLDEGTFSVSEGFPSVVEAMPMFISCGGMLCRQVDGDSEKLYKWFLDLLSQEGAT